MLAPLINITPFLHLCEGGQPLFTEYFTQREANMERKSICSTERPLDLLDSCCVGGTQVYIYTCTRSKNFHVYKQCRCMYTYMLTHVHINECIFWCFTGGKGTLEQSRTHARCCWSALPHPPKVNAGRNKVDNPTSQNALHT